MTQTIYKGRVHPSKKFLLVPYSLIRNFQISDSCCRFLEWVNANSDGFNESLENILELYRKLTGYGRDKMRSIIKSGMDAGYIIRKKLRGANGRFTYEYHVFLCIEEAREFAEMSTETEEAIAPPPEDATSPPEPEPEIEIPPVTVEEPAAQIVQVEIVQETSIADILHQKAAALISRSQVEPQNERREVKPPVVQETSITTQRNSNYQTAHLQPFQQLPNGHRLFPWMDLDPLKGVTIKSAFAEKIAEAYKDYPAYKNKPLAEKLRMIKNKINRAQYEQKIFDEMMITWQIYFENPEPEKLKILNPLTGKHTDNIYEINTLKGMGLI